MTSCQAADVIADTTTITLPGFVNGHSHAFQRAMRGRVEVASLEHPHDDFWAWRRAMYDDANRVTPEQLEALATWCYADMVQAGYVAVAEFHYLHHDGDVGRAGMFANAVVAAARNVGIRLLLLPCAYARAGAGKVATSAQQRFLFPSSLSFLEHARSLRDQHTGVGHGVAIHSVRACPWDWMEAIAAHANDHQLPLHVHACEQRRELEECQQEHGCSPIELLHRCGALTERTTVVHATHIDDHDIALLASSGATVCLTPSTEANLGDGLCPINSLHTAGVRLTIGSDSHARIDPFAELRRIEEHERLRLEKRTVMTAPGQRLAQALLPIGTLNGWHSLQLQGDNDRVVCTMPIEGRGGDHEAGIDALFVAGGAHDVRQVTIHNVNVVDNGQLQTLDRMEVDAAAIAVLQQWRRS
jgi:formimidoylglutamate deiminase